MRIKARGVNPARDHNIVAAERRTSELIDRLFRGVSAQILEPPAQSRSSAVCTGEPRLPPRLALDGAQARNESSDFSFVDALCCLPRPQQYRAIPYTPIQHDLLPIDKRHIHCELARG